MIPELPVEKLRNICDPASLPCSSSAELPPGKTIIGQERAVRALQFGLGISSFGFNIYVSGLPGTGRTTAVKGFLEELASAKPVPAEVVYVYNFQEPSRPNAILLPAGTARTFQTDMKVLLEGARKEIRLAFDSEEYANKREEITRVMQMQKEQLQSRVSEKAREQGFVIQQTPIGFMTVPLKDDQLLKEEDFLKLSQAERDEIMQRQKVLQAEIETAIRQAKGIEKKINEELVKLDRQVALYSFSIILNELREKYKDINEVDAYLTQVQEDILEHLGQFRGEEEGDGSLQAAAAKDRFFNRYAINVLVEHDPQNGAPVVIELNPTYTNLFGRIENEAMFGTLVTDFTLVRSGSLHRANGGYLVLPADDVLRAPLAWDSLKRALRNREITIEDASERLGLLSTRSLQPEAVPLDVKVILIGQPVLYQLLLVHDEDFSELFKVKADFDSRMERTPESIHDYIVFVSSVCENNQLKHLDCTGLAELVEYGSRLADDQTKLSTRFGELTDVIREANYYASADGVEQVSAVQVRRAIEERQYRSALTQERLQEMTRRNVLMIDVEGSKSGQVNGLAVMGMGDMAFGHPSRITAAVGVGREGVVDIERQAEMGGPTHTKGVLILAGYLTGRFAQDKPLSLSARLVFEQNYSGVDGDSASSTELYAILSALTDAPINQGIAVTGSVNQKGEVQAIGGVNEKVEGFFEVCRMKGLTGSQGVMIPRANESNLMLKAEVLAAVKEGKFHLWSVASIEEGIEVLTGVPAGEIFAQANQRLEMLGKTLIRFGKDEKKPADNNNDENNP